MSDNMRFKLNEYHKNISQNDLLTDLKRVANLLNKSYLSRSDYKKMVDTLQIHISEISDHGLRRASLPDLKQQGIQKTFNV